MPKVSVFYLGSCSLPSPGYPALLEKARISCCSGPHTDPIFLDFSSLSFRDHSVPLDISSLLLRGTPSCSSACLWRPIFLEAALPWDAVCCSLSALTYFPGSPQSSKSRPRGFSEFQILRSSWISHRHLNLLSHIWLPVYHYPST